MEMNKLSKEKIPNYLIKRTFLTPNRVAVYFQDEVLTFKELHDRAMKMARRLSSQGVKRGQFTGILLKNSLETIVILCALQLIGVRAVMLNNRLSWEELKWQLEDSNASFFITEKSFHVIQSDLVIPTLIKEYMHKLEEVDFHLNDEIDTDEVCTVMYTSGTTGRPKGVLQSYGNHWWSAIGSALNMGLTEKDCWLCAVPLFHISGYSILMRSLIYGMPIVLHENFHESEVIKDIFEKKVTIMSVVTTMLMRMVEQLGEEKLPEHFRCMLLGGGPAPLPLLEMCAEKEIPVYQTYGMTETASQIVTLSPEYSLSKLGSAGKPLFPAQLKIQLPSGEEAVPNEAGEILVKGPNVTKGYLNRQHETEEKLKEGWLHTGDIGQLDAEGFLYVLDRRSDLIISGGENVYPAEIEAVLLRCEAIVDAGVTGVPDEKWGQVPVAFVVKRENSSVTESDILEFCSSRLAKYKLPKEVHFIEELPRNAARKLLRRKLVDFITKDDGS